ncbi:hypothetical protein ILUMI_25760 [Ignelater luminosus]|uniref:Retrovirus-related Pol polyprotein from transposon TNT 1-94-like beta-barrel domain-containing protein n=1 Tax=Ignelater luminosus TaxID=2038154 RepID=A0A8K0FZC8_IGNLU|nr:hypothetical protein ILUMI_25760 [Ignelater luminosus]
MVPDSGSTDHMSGNREWIESLRPCSRDVQISDGSIIKAEAIGKVRNKIANEVNSTIVYEVDEEESCETGGSLEEVINEEEVITEIHEAEIEENQDIKEKKRRKQGWCILSAVSLDENLTYDEATSEPVREYWKPAMGEEIKALSDNDVQAINNN